MTKFATFSQRIWLAFFFVISIIAAPRIGLAASSPSITTAPLSQSVLTGSNAVFTVVASGSAPLTYQWSLNGTNLANGTHIGGATTATLTVSNVVAGDAGIYQVVVSNSHGTATTNATLTVLFPASITAQPTNLTVNASNTATFNVLAGGTAPLKYQWRFNGAVLTGATNAGLTLTNVQAANAGNYAVVVTNNYCSVTSSVAVLNVILPPTIITQPTSQSAVVGNSAAFAVAIGGTPPLIGRWYFQSSNLTDSGNINGATTTNLTILNAQGSNAGNYFFVVTNSAGSITSDIVTLTVLFLPAVAIQPANAPGVLGGSVTLTANATGTVPLNFQWTRNGTNLTDGGSLSGATTTMLTITNLQLADAGAYSVVVTNLYGVATNSTTVSVTVPANTWVKWDASLGGNDHWYKAVVNSNALNWLQVDQIAHDEGGYLATVTSVAENNFVFSLVNDPVFFSGIGNNGSGPALGGVRTNSASAANLDWTWETGEPWDYTAWMPGQPDALTETRLEYWSGTQSVPTSGWNNLQPTDSNLGGYVIEREDFPFILTQPASGFAAVGTNVSLSVVALGTPTLNYQWLFNGTNLDGATNTSLTLLNVQVVQTGNYSVTVSNAFGAVISSNAALAVLTPPAITQSPTNQTLMTNATATFSAVATGDAPLSYRWRFNGSPLSDTVRIFGSATDTLTISNLLSSDNGSYTLTVTNPVGSAISTAALLTVLSPPAITVQPIGRSLPLGLSNILSAAASGSAPLSYQWQLNGTNILGATNTAYFIAAVKTNDLGVYQFVASNAVGVAVSSNALLTIGPVAAWGYNVNNQCLVPPGLSNVTSIAGSLNSSVAAQLDGNVTAWGGSLNTFTNSDWTNMVALSAGYNGAVALRSDGSVVGSPNIIINPLSYKLFFSNAVAVSAGYQHGLALRAEGTVVGWGSPAGNIPAGVVPPGLTHVTAISAGYQHSLALRSDGTVAAWGNGSATNVPPGLSNVTAIAAGTTHSLALKSDGTVVAWGTGLGLTNLPPNLSNIVAITASTYTDQRSTVSYAVRSNGTVIGWGFSGYGQTNIPAGLSNVVAIASAVNHTLALVNDGSPQIIRAPVGGMAWSGNDYVLKVVAVGKAVLNYQWLFNGTKLDGATNATLLIPAIQTTNAGNYQVVVTNAFGTAASWPVPVTVLSSVPFLLTQSPTNLTGWLGNKLSLTAAAGGSGPLQYQWRLNGTNLPGATNDTLTFNRLHLTNAGNYVLTISNSFGGIITSLIKLTVQQVVVWGDNANGQTNMPPGLTNVIAISANFYNNIVLKTDGTVTIWGNTSGLYVPTNSVVGVSNVVEVSAGYNQELVLKSNGRPYMWGQGTSSTVTNLVAAQSNIVAVAATSSSAGGALLRADGTLLQVSFSGISTNSGVTNGIALATCDDGYLVLRADGKIYTYGGGLSGSGSGVSNVLALAAGRYQGLALKRDGTVMGIESFPVWPGVTNFAGVIDVASTLSFGSTPEFIVLSDGSIVWGNGVGLNAATNVPYGINSVQVLNAGNTHCLALLSDRDFPPVFLHTAVNTTNFIVSSKGSAQWFGQNNISHDGTNAAQSAAIGNNTATSMRTWVYGPTSAKFWWKVSSATNHGVLSFLAGGAVLTNVSGEADWQQVTVHIPPGGKILQWTYSKDGAGAAGQDAAWVDQLQFTNIRPSIVTQPVSQTVIGGSNITASFTVTVAGTPPFSYRWNKDGNLFVLHTNASADLLTFTNVTRTNSGTYYVAITNLVGGVTSSNVVLEVHVPQLLGAPAVQPDGSLAFSATDADGGLISSNIFAALQLQASTNLVDWTTLPNALIYSNGVIRVVDNDATNSADRFYRIIENW